MKGNDMVFLFPTPGWLIVFDRDSVHLLWFVCLFCDEHQFRTSPPPHFQNV